MRRLAILLGALVVPALPLVAAAPAHAAGTICVNVPAGGCPAGAAAAASIPAAITLATSGTTIKVGPGQYTDGPYVLPAGVSLKGAGSASGASSTVLSLAAGSSATYLTVTGATASDFRVSLAGSNGATGVEATGGATLDNVSVGGPGTPGSTGLLLQQAVVDDTTVNVSLGTGSTAVVGQGSNILTNSTLKGGAAGYRLTGGSDTVSRVVVQLATTAVAVDAGTLTIDDSLLDLGTTGTAGLLAHPTAGGATATALASQLTVVGGATGARGVAADATGSGTRTASVTLRSSVVRGPATSLAVDSGTGSSTASLAVDHSAYDTTQGTVPTDPSNLVGVDPGFVDPAAGNYALRAGSAVVDKGIVSTSTTVDLAGNARSFDGDRNGVAVPDMGAYELVDVVAPKTTFTAGPSGPTADNTPLFTFRSEAGATFACRVDAGPWISPCSSPVTTTPLADGPHTFSVQATDAVLNVENPPATLAFTVDTVAPSTAITKKPQKRFHKKKVKFKFASSEAGARFQCNLDKRGWRTCQATYRFNVKVGRHRLEVRAVDAAGNVDPSPAKYRFHRVKRHRHR